MDEGRSGRPAQTTGTGADQERRARTEAGTEAETGSGAGAGGLGRPRTSVLIGAAAALLLGLGGGAWVFNSSAGSCKGSPLRITVAADPDIAPAVRQVAARFNVQTHQVNGRCVRADVIAPASAALARSLAGQNFGARGVAAVDAWIPGSSMWLSLARAAGAGHVPAGGTPLAASPVVLAVTGPVADELRAAKVEADWRLLAKGRAGGLSFTRRMLDPVTGLSGIIPLLALQQLAEDATDGADEGDRAVRDYVRDMRAGTTAGVDPMFADLTALTRDDRALLVTTEQSIVTYNQTHRPNPAAALVPAEGTLPVDYPFAVIASDPGRRNAAEAFQYSLSTRLARQTFQRHGFRAPDGTLGEEYARSHDLSGAAPKSLRIPAQDEIAAAVRAWDAGRRPDRTLVLVDVSRSMSQIATRNTTRADTALLGARAGTRLGRTVRALLDGLPLLPAGTDLGAWEVGPSAGGGAPYKEIVSLGPIDGRAGSRTRREQLARALPGLRTRPRGDTGLYGALPAAYRRLKETRDDGSADSVLVLTDGDDEDALMPSGLIETLRRDQDAERPIRIDIVAFGPEASGVGLRQITDLTGGELFQTTDPATLGAVFATAMSARLCLLTCAEP